LEYPTASNQVSCTFSFQIKEKLLSAKKMPMATTAGKLLSINRSKLVKLPVERSAFVARLIIYNAATCT